ncbi:hypothetical protein LLS1_01470 [Leifsonia sp. LS1]|nr:hypothetical protein LLS1_01470 [Leifsonia sp. LS1]
MDMQHRTSSLTPEQVDYLLRSGDFTPEELAEAQASIARGELAAEENLTRRQAVEASLSENETARRLIISDDQLTRLRTDGDLYAFRLHGRFRYPLWQFTNEPGRPVLPHLRPLSHAFPHDWHPAGVLAFMSTPKSSTRINGEPVTPIQWLIAGGDPNQLVHIIESFLQS